MAPLNPKEWHARAGIAGTGGDGQNMKLGMEWVPRSPPRLTIGSIGLSSEMSPFLDPGL